jgi:hypothetical protein
MGKVHQRRIVNETKNKSAAKLLEETSSLLRENAG